MGSLRHLLLLLILPFLARAQNQSGFISIDCGLSRVSNYTDEGSGITYVSDAGFVDSGKNIEISPQPRQNETIEKQFLSLRSFPEGKRNCYNIKSAGARGNKYLIRARFMYGNYDGKDQAPSFDLYLGVNLWTKVNGSLDNNMNNEIIHVPTSDHIHICLVNNGEGTPFVSALELRPLPDNIYATKDGSSLVLHGRYDYHPSPFQAKRYKGDVYDRLWNSLDWTPLMNTSLTNESSIIQNRYQVPFTIMKSAYTRNESKRFLTIQWNRNLLPNTRYYLYMHFAELLEPKLNRSREFTISINGVSRFGPLVPEYLEARTFNSIKGSFSTVDGSLKISLNSTETSDLPPFINAFELYSATNLSQQETNQTEVEAILRVKSAFGLKKNWQGDPCLPEALLWDGLRCDYFIHNFYATIVSLNLSSSQLVGKIDPSIANLTNLEYLDLSSNKLNGTVPEFFSELKFLKSLNLKGNDLEGPIPPRLLERAKNGLLLGIDDYLIGIGPSPLPPNEPSSSLANNHSSATMYSHQKSKYIAPIVAAFSAFLLHFCTIVSL